MSKRIPTGKPNGRPTKMLTEQQIRQAMKHTKSNHAAARYFNMSFPTYKQYAKLYIDKETGKSLYELHCNPYGKGIPKWQYKAEGTRLQDLLKNGMSIESYSVEKLKGRLLYEGVLANECNKCHFNEMRVLDYKVPLILSFKDGNKNNWLVENLEMLCYNCYFLYIGDLFTDKQIKFLEDSTAVPQPSNQTEWELDEYWREHFSDLGLMTKKDTQDPGSEYIDII